jgi:hypothetical protein
MTIPPRFLALSSLVAVAAFSRLIPHAPNFTPVAAIALFGGATFSDKRAAILVPLAALLLSDAVIGFYSGAYVVYAAFALIVCLGFTLCGKRSVLRIGAASVTGALLFFAVTNFGVWAMGTLYPKTLAGLGACYVAGIPFFGNTLASDLLYCALLFGVMTVAERRWPALTQPSVLPA